MSILRPTGLDTTAGQQSTLDALASKLKTAISSVTNSARKAANVALIGGAALGVVAGCGDDDNGRTIYGEGGSGGETTTATGGSGGNVNTGGSGGAGSEAMTGLNVCNMVSTQADWVDFVKNNACNPGAVSDCQKMSHNPAGVEVSNQFAVVNCDQNVDLEDCILVVSTPKDDTINWAVAADKNGVTDSQSFNTPQQITFEAGETNMRAAGKVDGTANIFSDCQ